MKLLVITESYWPNLDGGALFERRVSHAMAKRSHEVSVWAPGSSWRSYEERDGDTTIYREKSLRQIINTRYKVSYWPFWSARSIIRKVHPDVIHIHNFSLMGLAGLFWARRYKIPIVATNHFMPENLLLNLPPVGPLYPLIYRFVWWYLVVTHKRCDYVTSPTKTATDLLLKHGLRAPHKAISNGLDTETFQPGLDIERVRKLYKLPIDRPILLYLGRIDGEKRLDILINSFALLPKEQPWHAVFAGDGRAKRSLEQQADKLGIRSHITFTGFVEESDKAALYNAADLFVMPSPAELQSIVTLEAMSCGLPLVAVDVAALSELCRDGENGFLYPHEDDAALAEKIMQLLVDPARRREFGKRSRDIVLNEHQEQQTYDQYETIYCNLKS